jgi:hypothetical protein
MEVVILKRPDPNSAGIFVLQSLGQLHRDVAKIVVVNESADKADHNAAGRAGCNRGVYGIDGFGGIGRGQGKQAAECCTKEEKQLRRSSHENQSVLSYQMFGTTFWMHEPGTSEFSYKSSKLRASSPAFRMLKNPL